MSSPPRTILAKTLPDPAAHSTRQLLDELDALMQRMLALPVSALEEELKNEGADNAARTPAVAGTEPPGNPASEPNRADEDTSTRASLIRLDSGGDLPGPVGDISQAPSLWLTEPAVHVGEQRLEEQRHKDADSSPVISSESVYKTREVEEELSDRPAPAVDEPSELVPPAPAFNLAADIKSRSEKAEEEWERSLPVSREVLEAIGHRSHQERAAPFPGPLARPVYPLLPALTPPSAPPAWLQPVVWINGFFDALTSRLGAPGRWLRSREGRALLGWVGLGLLAGAVGWLVMNEVGWTW